MLLFQQSLPAVPGEGEPALPDVPTEEPEGIYFECYSQTCQQQSALRDFESGHCGRVAFVLRCYC